MIRYPVSSAELRERIASRFPGWLQRAEQRTRDLRAAKRYAERRGIWSEVKAVWSALQYDKCAYCERRLAAPGDGGRIEHDLEHYRPKSRVRVWPPHGEDPWPTQTGIAMERGYYWLAYDISNYAVACKKCNVPLKSDYFPVRGPRGRAGTTTKTLNASERPLLLRPVGEGPGNPDQELGFNGMTAVPLETGADRDAAQLTIRFYRLNGREELLRERAEKLIALENAFRLMSVPARRAQAENDIRSLCHPASAHSSCVRSMIALLERDETEADALLMECRAYLDSLEGPRAP